MQDKLQKIKDTFPGLSFIEETHSYYVNERKLDTSVSGVLKNYVEFVNFDEIALETDKKLGLPLRTTKTLWGLNSGAACASGNFTHYFGEMYAFHRNLEPKNKLQEAVVKFWNDLPDHIIPVFTELQMYHLEYRFGGTADIILYNTKTGKFIIADYKTNKKLNNNFAGRRLKAPFTMLLDSDLNKYQLQFSLYQILFEQTGFEVSARKLIWLLPDGTYQIYNTDDYTGLLRQSLKETYNTTGKQ